MMARDLARSCAARRPSTTRGPSAAHSASARTRERQRQAERLAVRCPRTAPSCCVRAGPDGTSRSLPRMRLHWRRPGLVAEVRGIARKQFREVLLERRRPRRQSLADLAPRPRGREPSPEKDPLSGETYDRCPDTGRLLSPLTDIAPEVCQLPRRARRLRGCRSRGAPWTPTRRTRTRRHPARDLRARGISNVAGLLRRGRDEIDWSP